MVDSSYIASIVLGLGAAIVIFALSKETWGMTAGLIDEPFMPR